MPETIRTAHERLRSRPRRGGFPSAFGIALLFIACASPARAATGVWSAVIDAVHGAALTLSRQDIATLILTIALLSFTAFATLVLVRTRRQAERIATAAGDEQAALYAEIDRFKALLLAEPQVLVDWAAGADEPDIVGDTSILVPGDVPDRVLAFGAWLEPQAAQQMERAVEALRAEGRGFAMTLTTTAGRPIEAEGRAVAGRAVLRLRDVGGIERELADLVARYDKLMSDVETMRAVLELAACPGLGTRPGRPPDLRQLRLRARGGSGRRRRRGGTRARTARPRGA